MAASSLPSASGRYLEDLGASALMLESSTIERLAFPEHLREAWRKCSNRHRAEPANGSFGSVRRRAQLGGERRPGRDRRRKPPWLNLCDRQIYSTRHYPLENS